MSRKSIIRDALTVCFSTAFGYKVPPQFFEEKIDDARSVVSGDDVSVLDRLMDANVENWHGGIETRQKNMGADAQKAATLLVEYLDDSEE